MKRIEVVGKFSEINWETLESLKHPQTKHYYKQVALSMVAFTAVTMLMNDYASAATLASTTDQPVNLNAILKFVDWLIYIIRWVASSIVGLVVTYAGYRWTTDISGNGMADAKKILKNSATGMLVIQFGAGVANYFVDKIQHFL